MAGSGSTTSSMTSTSHTLTHAPSLSFLSALVDPTKPSGSMEMLELFEAVKAGNRHNFLQPSAALPNASLQLAKATLDAYASQLSDEQQQRQKEANKKRKRADQTRHPIDVLKVRKLHVDGFESGQVWQQAKRIITSTLQDAEQLIHDLEDRKEIQVNGVSGTTNPSDSDGNDLGNLSNSTDEDSSGELDDDIDEEAFENEMSSGEDEDDLLGVEGEALSQGEEDGEEDDDLKEGGDSEDSEVSEDDEPEPLVEDPNGLNDGFFSIDDFNKTTQMWEDADARADPNVDQGSEDEELDWHANPLSGQQPVTSSKSRRPKKLQDDEDDEMQSGADSDEDDDDEGGPTFGNMDLDAPEGDSDLEDEMGAEDNETEGNANNIFYKDFFAPPRRKGAKPSRPRKLTATERGGPAEKEVERAMADVRRDLFEDESEREDSEDALSEVSAGDPKSRRSAHERRQAKLAEEIRKLEAANVAKKDWTMSGEARAVERPVNSLLEEDLDFEHAGKPVPVITPDVNESIEDLIKRRILAREFDEVIRRRPDAAEFSSHTRRGLAQVEDTKSKQGLAEIYEEEHVKNANPDSYVSKADEKLRKDEKEVEQMWQDISAKLDALSSWHYRPKPAAPTLTIVPDIATISMEDAQPTTAQGVGGGDNTLAPQEVYKAGKDNAEKGEIVSKSGLPVAKQEMTREDKARKRRREKERIRKADGLESKQPQSAKARQRQETLGDLKKGGVRVINKKGEVVDIDGNKAKSTKTASSGTFKL
ncbi:Mpp10 protein-domain-containing protein [Xylaria bambusicola]|uniref:Mpp10 protein-domain-containing protein n=1 Tax=Xylaria bambusicola TaxID=326684 RepID=UPI0020085EE6|nr:Mpp10 protein-domain-containing protein [Xylaria bambusicola]KAI0505982.1 Mpp10 protein-domain-containing protein [Xylaria bambusicola]